MHEMSLAGGVLRIVEEAAMRERFTRVRRLTLEAGALSGIEVRALRFALEAIAPGTCLAGAEIEIDEPPGRAWCPRCRETVPITSRVDACPRCAGWQLQPTEGTELKLRDLVVLDEAAAG
ncbi:MAG: hydrogenase maturation nickel metallochaperone HypA [Rubrivivax sp.]|nr:hydrogenase maturation nickel metallochaperone HypA [Rubrivivax sp.]